MDTLGEDQAVGYNIGCAFHETARNSALLGPKVEVKRIKLNPNAFHG